MNPEEVYEIILDEIQQGNISPEDADVLVKENTEYPNLFGLQMAIESAADFIEAEELNEIADSPIRNLLGSMFQGFTQRFGDEALATMRPFEGMAEDMSQAQALRQEHAPDATALGEAAGMFMLPAAPAGLAAAAPRTMPVAKAGLRGAARGGLIGGTTGAASAGLMAAGGAEPGERIEAAKDAAMLGGGAGAVIGAPFGAFGGMLGQAAGRGGRVADKMLSLSNRAPDMTRLGQRQVMEGAKQEVQQAFYQPLQEEFKNVADPAIKNWLKVTSANPMLRSMIPRQFRASTQRVRSGPGRASGSRVIGSSIEPSFQQLQDLRGDLRGMAYDRAGDVIDREALAAAQELDELMGDAFGQPLRTADRLWAQISADERALDKGFAMYNKTSDEIQDLRRGLTESQRNAFDDGRLARISTELRLRDETAVGLLRQYMDAGPESIKRVADMFPGGAEGTAFQQFQNLMAREASAARIADFWSSTLKSGAIAATGGAIAGGIIGRGEQR